MTFEHTKNQINKIRIDALYGKKRHFNAADRIEGYNKRINTIIISLNVLMGSTFLYLLTELDNNWIKYVGSILAFISALLVALSKYYDFNSQMEGHRIVANRYLSLSKKGDCVNAYISDGVISDDEIINKLDEISSEIAEINRDANSFPTNKSDYGKAQSGFQVGEETYTESELKI